MRSLHWQADSYPLDHQGHPSIGFLITKSGGELTHTREKFRGGTNTRTIRELQRKGANQNHHWVLRESEALWSGVTWEGVTEDRRDPRMRPEGPGYLETWGRPSWKEAKEVREMVGGAKGNHSEFRRCWVGDKCVVSQMGCVERGKKPCEIENRKALGVSKTVDPILWAGTALSKQHCCWTRGMRQRMVNYIIAIATTSASFDGGEEHFTGRAEDLGFTLDLSLSLHVWFWQTREYCIISLMGEV